MKRTPTTPLIELTGALFTRKGNHCFRCELNGEGAQSGIRGLQARLKPEGVWPDKGASGEPPKKRPR